VNDAQTLFVAFFAISYTLMLGYGQSYNIWDTYDAWRGKRQSIRRFFLGFILLNIIPISNFAWILSALASVALSVEWNLANFLLTLLIVFLPFIIIGYYRLCVSLLYKYPYAFYRSKRRLENFTKADEHGEPISFGARFWPGVIYIAIPNGFLLLFLAIKQLPSLSVSLDPGLVNWILLGIVVVEFLLLLTSFALLRGRTREIHKIRIELTKCQQGQKLAKVAAPSASGNPSPSAQDEPSA